jgi:formate dehydrogenase subunit gamma
MTASGLTLMFPFFGTDIQTLQWVLLAHALVALLFVALILGHIYIGTVGMEGAIDAMWDGYVDRNWAEEHHRLWVEELDREGRPQAGRDGSARAVPAE